MLDHRDDSPTQPEPTSARVYQGQRYEFLGTEPYQTRRGAVVTLHLWRGHCAACGEPFEFKASAQASKFSPNQRCAACKRPGVRVVSCGAAP